MASVDVDLVHAMVLDLVTMRMHCERLQRGVLVSFLLLID